MKENKSGGINLIYINASEIEWDPAQTHFFSTAAGSP